MLEELNVVAAGRPHFPAMLFAEFPSIFVRPVSDGTPHLTASQWEQPWFDTWAFDCSVDALAEGPFTLCIADDNGNRPGFAMEVLNRCQRVIGRRNLHSHGQLFDRVLKKHRQLHDVSKPLVRADYNHALDVWQWLLRLDPGASISVQFAALFHDIERLASESESRVEHLAADYQSFKDEHARRGAEMTDAVLEEAGVPAPVRARVVEIVTAHERQSADGEVALLNDADALSFFSLNANGYADYFGPEQTRRKVAYTLNRMRESAREKLKHVRLRPDVRAMME